VLAVFFLVYIFHPSFFAFYPYISIAPLLGSYLGLVSSRSSSFAKAAAGSSIGWHRCPAQAAGPDVHLARRRRPRPQSPRSGVARHLTIPLAVALALETRERFEAFRIACAAPISPSPCSRLLDRAAGPTWRRGVVSRRLRAAVARFLEQADFTADDALRARRPTVILPELYCPRCHGQFEIAAGECHHCGQPLAPLPGRAR